MTERGEVGRVKCLEDEGGAVPSITDIYYIFFAVHCTLSAQY